MGALSPGPRTPRSPISSRTSLRQPRRPRAPPAPASAPGHKTPGSRAGVCQPHGDPSAERRAPPPPQTLLRAVLPAGRGRRLPGASAPPQPRAPAGGPAVPRSCSVPARPGRPSRRPQSTRPSPPPLLSSAAALYPGSRSPLPAGSRTPRLKGTSSFCLDTPSPSPDAGQGGRLPFGGTG